MINFKAIGDSIRLATDMPTLKTFSINASPTVPLGNEEYFTIRTIADRATPYPSKIKKVFDDDYVEYIHNELHWATIEIGARGSENNNAQDLIEKYYASLLFESVKDFLGEQNITIFDRLTIQNMSSYQADYIYKRVAYVFNIVFKYESINIEKVLISKEYDINITHEEN